MPVKQLGVALTETHTSKRLALGSRFERQVPQPNQDRGEQVWVYIQMTGGAAAAGDVIERAAGSSTHVGVLGAVTTTQASALGVAQHAIAQDSYGWILESGYSPSTTADGSVTADADIVPAAAGDVTDFTAGNEHRVIGVALATDAGAQTNVASIINCR